MLYNQYGQTGAKVSCVWFSGVSLEEDFNARGARGAEEKIWLGH